MKSIRMSLKEIRKKKALSLLILLVCTLALYTALSAFTNASGAVYQQRLFERNIGADLQRVLHLDYQRTEEDAAFASVLREYLEEIKTLPGVAAVGQFDAAGVYFRELENSEEYKERNAALLKGQKYENYPAISQLLSVDEEILPLVKNGITEYETADSGFLPIYASEMFRDFLPKGSILTDARTGDRYQVVGYLPQGMLWPEEDDLIRFPMVSLDGWFVAPFTQQSRSDIITQLSSLHNTYLFLEEGADADAIKEQVRSGSLARGFEASALPLSEEYEAYRAQTAALTARQLALAFFVCAMAVCSVGAVLTTNALLKKRQYGILLANGFTVLDIAAELIGEIVLLLSCSGVLAWGAKWAELMRSEDLFRPVLLSAHLGVTPWLCLLLMLAFTLSAAVVPVIKLFRYQPCELIGGDVNG